MKLSRSVLALLGTAAATVTLTACGSTTNAGGDTTCGDYLALEKGEQADVIRAFMESKGDADPAGAKVTLSRLSAVAYCNTAGAESDPISNIDG